MDNSETRLGRCYELAWQHLLDHPAATLAHGIIGGRSVGAGGAIVFHAWLVEAEMVWEPISARWWPEEVYVGLFSAQTIYVYDSATARQRAADTGHYGPWDPLPALAGW